MRRCIKRVLVVGLGSIGKRHLENVQHRLPLAQIAALRSAPSIVDRDDGVVEFYSLQDAINFFPDIALICSPSVTHLSVAKELAYAGVDMVIEKPLAHDSSGVDELLEIVISKKLKAMVGYNLRFSDSLVELRKIINHGKYGRVLCARAEVGQYLPDWRPNIDYRRSVSAQRVLGGGALLELSHELDYLCWLFGYPVKVWGDVRTVSSLNIDVEDLVNAQLDCLSGDRAIPVNLQLDFLQRKASRTCKVVCENATIVWDAVTNRVIKEDGQGTELMYQGSENRNKTYLKELDTFVTCVQEGTDVPIPLEEGLNVLHIIDALRRSSNNSKWVEL